MTTTNEKRLDAAHAARDLAERNLADAMTARDVAMSEHDSSDSSWRKVERAEALVVRRRVELQNAQQREREAQLVIAEAERREDARALDALLAQLGPSSWFDAVDVLARALLPHVLTVAEIERVDDVAAERWERQARARALAKKLGSTPRSVGVERSADEWVVAVGFRLAQLAREHGVELTALFVERPATYETRKPRLHEREVTIAASVDAIERAQAAATTWNECESVWRRETHETTEPKKGTEDGQTDPRAAE